MVDEIIEYQSGSYNVFSFNGTIETKTNKGIKCIWNCQRDDHCRTFTWIFNWDELKRKGVKELSGYIILKRLDLPDNHDICFDVNLTDNFDKILIVSGPEKNKHTVLFTYRLTHHRQLEIDDNVPYDAIFLPSDLTDAILLVDGQKLHVNQAFLSFHSEYFRALFTSSFKEGNMDEIPISDVTFKDFGCLLSMVYPQNSFPNDRNVEKLLELSDRFLMPSVIRSVENHLLNTSKIDNRKMMWLADKYSMPKLLEKTLRETNSLEKVKKIKESPEFKDLSDKTLATLCNQIMKLV